MSKPIQVTRAEAAHILLRWQGLSGAPRFHGQAGAVDFVRQAGCVQFDPLDPCGRSPELTLHARVHDLSRADIGDLLYGQHVLLDHWDKNMSIVAAEDFPRLKRRRKLLVNSLRKHKEIERSKKAVLAEIETRGPLSSGDLSFNEKVDWWWTPTSIARATLETLFQSGDLVVYDRSGTHRRFDLARRHLPPECLVEQDGFASQAAYHAWCIERRIRATGLLWDKRSDAFLTIDGMTAEKRSRAFRSLEKQKKILPVEVNGIPETFYVPAEALELPPDNTPRTEIIGPLDSFLWDRALIHTLFDFHYRWEVYTPKAKRQYGYYVKPVLQDDKLIGRIEVKRDREAGVLRVLGAWWEHPVEPKGLHDCLRRLCVFNEMKEYEVEPGVCMK